MLTQGELRNRALSFSVPSLAHYRPSTFGPHDVCKVYIGHYDLEDLPNSELVVTWKDLQGKIASQLSVFGEAMGHLEHPQLIELTKWLSRESERKFAWRRDGLAEHIRDKLVGLGLTDVTQYVDPDMGARKEKLQQKLKDICERLDAHDVRVTHEALGLAQELGNAVLP